MKTGHILLKTPFKAIKTAFKDYKLLNTEYYIEKKHVTIKKGLVIAINYKLAKSFNLETIGSIKQPTQSEIEKDILANDLIIKEKLEIKRQSKIAVAILTKNSNLLNKLINKSN